jgi:hypothetical protein
MTRLEAMRHMIMRAEQLGVRFFLETVRSEVGAQVGKSLNLADALKVAHLSKTTTQEGGTLDIVIDKLKGQYSSKDITQAIEGLRRFHQHHHQFTKILDMWISSEAFTEQEKIGLLALADIVGGSINYDNPESS